MVPGVLDHELHGLTLGLDGLVRSAVTLEKVGKLFECAGHRGIV